MKKKILIIVTLLGLICVTLIIVFLSVLNIETEITAPNNIKNETIALKWNNALNRTQTGNTCSSHAIMAVAYVGKDLILDPYTIYNAIPDKLTNGYVYPWGVVNYLKTINIESKIHYLGSLSKQDKISWLKIWLNKGKPVILIIGNKKSLHYVTILGYSNTRFYIYDSLKKEDLNAALPGNVSLEYEKVVETFSSAEFLGVKINIVLAIE